ncbi:MAG: glycosyltransferase family 2 protein [bacterium]
MLEEKHYKKISKPKFAVFNPLNKFGDGVKPFTTDQTPDKQSQPKPTFSEIGYVKTSILTNKIVDAILKLSVLIMVASFVIASIYYGSFVKVWEITISRGRVFSFFTYASVSYSLITLLYLLFRTFLWFGYKPYTLKQDEPLPFVSIIIPAYNEGALVEKAIRAAVESGYPHDRLEVICVDDGSKDDTFLYMQKAKARYPDNVILVKLPHNMGKRHALYNGFINSNGDIFVTIDSDSIIEKGAIHNIIAPFLKNKQIGAVAGNVKVLNKNEGLIPRMLDVSFILSFDFTRACQSTYGAVLCCPGAFSAYRANIVKDVIDKWLNERFLGEICTYGEDRALTNLILKKGFYTVYQNNAVVYTKVPRTYNKLTRMYLRWERSNIRESIILSTFILKKYRSRHRLLPFINFVITNLRYPFQYYALVFLFVNLVLYPVNIFRYLSVVGVISLVYMIYYIRAEKNSDFIYGVLYSYFSIFTLQWIFPYAMFSLKSKSWMTR